MVKKSIFRTNRWATALFFPFSFYSITLHLIGFFVDRSPSWISYVYLFFFITTVLISVLVIYEGINFRGWANSKLRYIHMLFFGFTITTISIVLTISFEYAAPHVLATIIVVGLTIRSGFIVMYLRDGYISYEHSVSDLKDRMKKNSLKYIKDKVHDKPNILRVHPNIRLILKDLPVEIEIFEDWIYIKSGKARKHAKEFIDKYLETQRL